MVVIGFDFGRFVFGLVVLFGGRLICCVFVLRFGCVIIDC